MARVKLSRVLFVPPEAYVEVRKIAQWWHATPESIDLPIGVEEKVLGLLDEWVGEYVPDGFFIFSAETSRGGGLLLILNNDDGEEVRMRLQRRKA